MSIAFFSRYQVAVPRAFFPDKLHFTSGVLTAAFERGFVAITDSGITLDLPGFADLLMISLGENKEVQLDLGRRVNSRDLGNSLLQSALGFGVYDYGALLLNSIQRNHPGAWAIDPVATVATAAQLLANDESPGRLGRALVALAAGNASIGRNLRSRAFDDLNRDACPSRHSLCAAASSATPTGHPSSRLKRANKRERVANHRPSGK